MSEKRKKSALSGTLSAFDETSEPAIKLQESEPEAAKPEIKREPEATSPTVKEEPPSEPPVTPPMAEIVQNVTSTSRLEQLKTIVTRFLPLKMADPIDAGMLRLQYRTWLLRTTMPATQIEPYMEWVSNLSDEALVQFHQQLRTHCTDMGFRLHWLFNHQITATTVKSQLDAIALSYIDSYRQMGPLQGQFEQLEQYDNWLENYRRADYKPLNQKLFVALSDRGVLPPPPATIYLNSESARWEYVYNVLLDASRRHPAQFLEALASL